MLAVGHFRYELIRMFTILFVLSVGLAATAAKPASDRIVGGSVTTIETIPMAAAVLIFTSVNYMQLCGGSILNNRAILSAAHCFGANARRRFRVRVGSSTANSGGVVYNTNRIINHPNYNSSTNDNDIAIIRTSSPISFNNNVRAGNIAGAGYDLSDNQHAWAVGWGKTSYGGPPSEQLRQVEVRTVNQDVCRQQYVLIGRAITDNMLCTGSLVVGGGGQCEGDFGGPLLVNNVIVGVSSWGDQCAFPLFPGVSTRVSRFTNWIINNA